LLGREAEFLQLGNFEEWLNCAFVFSNQQSKQNDGLRLKIKGATVILLVLRQDVLLQQRTAVVALRVHRNDLRIA
jgi:hypothetical protein